MGFFKELDAMPYYNGKFIWWDPMWWIDHLDVVTEVENKYWRYAKFYRALAIIFLLLCIIWVVIVSIFSTAKFFPRAPSNSELLMRSIKRY